MARVIDDLWSSVDATRYEMFLACHTNDFPERAGVYSGLPLFPTTPAKAIRGVFAIRRLVKELGIDVLHSHHRFTSVVARLVSLSTGCRFTSTVHDLASGGAVMTRFGTAPIVTVFSEAVENHLTETFHIPRSHIRRVPMGLPLVARPTAIEQKATRRSLGTEESAPVVAYSGRLDWEKGPDLLLAAAPAILAQIPEAVFWIAGSGDLEAELRAQARALGIEDRLRFTGWRDDVAAVVGSADVAVIPSRREGFGRSVVEAMALRMPVVAVATGGITSLVENEKTALLVPAEDASAIARSAVRLLTDRSLADALAAQAYAAVVGRYGTSAMAGAFQRIYDELLVA
ncbi:MAG TPA: glycosyltransferase [Thermoanaerobaculia bacterium]